MTPREMAELRYLLRVATRNRSKVLAMCSGKVAYQTRSDAELAIRPHKRGEVRSYRCHICHAWHVGTRNPAYA